MQTVLLVLGSHVTPVDSVCAPRLVLSMPALNSVREGNIFGPNHSVYLPPLGWHDHPYPRSTSSFEGSCPHQQCACCSQLPSRNHRHDTVLLQSNALGDLPLELQRRIMTLQRKPHLLARARAGAKLDTAAGGDAAAEYVPPNPERFWTTAPGAAPLDPRSGAGSAAAAAPMAPGAVEDASLIMTLGPKLAHRDIPAVKDRRQANTRALDTQAVKVRKDS